MKNFKPGKERNAKTHWNSSPISWQRASYEIDKQLDKNAIIVSELDTRTPLNGWI